MVYIIKKKLIPTVIIFVLILSTFCLPVFAADDENLISENFDNWYYSADSTAEANISYNSTTDLNTLTFPSSSRGAFVSYYTIPSMNYNHTFSLSFDYRGYLNLFNLLVYLQDGDDFQNAYLIANISSSSSPYQSVSYQFVPNSVLSNPSNVRLVFHFDIVTNSSQSVYIRYLNLVDLTGSSPAYSGLTGAINNYIQPSINWFISQTSNFFTIIESQWYYLFIWYVFNSALIIWIVGHSVFDWIDTFHVGMLSWGIHKYSDNKKQAQYEKIHSLRLQEAQIRYEQRRKKITEDWEVRNYMSKQKGFITFAEAKEKVIELKKNRDKNSGSDDK